MKRECADWGGEDWVDMGALNTSLDDASCERESHDRSPVGVCDTKLRVRVALQWPGYCALLAVGEKGGKDLPVLTARSFSMA